MTDYWKNYWDDHARGVSSDDPLIQVQRSLEGRPIPDAQFGRITDHIVAQLELDPAHTVLDLCCGNGLLSAAIEPLSSGVVAVDFCDRLLDELPVRTSSKTAVISGDVREVDFPPESFDRVLLACALQHFDDAEVIRLFRKVAGMMRAGGLFLVTDIPDRAKMWAFFNDGDRERLHFDNRENGTPILGTWFDRSWLEKLAQHAGFSEATALAQPEDFPYAHYRIDLRCRT